MKSKSLSLNKVKITVTQTIQQFRNKTPIVTSQISFGEIEKTALKNFNILLRFDN